MATPEQKPVGGKTTSPVSAGSVSGEASNAAPSPSAAQTAVRHGGSPGGKPRKDGLPAGSVEAAAADREKDKIRKQASRAVAAQLRPEPAALPSAAVPGQTATQDSGGRVILAGGPAQPAVVVPWDAQLIKPLLEKMIEAAENGRLAKFAIRCQALGDMPKLIKEIEQDAHMPPEAKAMLSISLPRCAAKWLNKSGVSAEYMDEISILTACILIWSHDRKAEQRLAKLIAEVQESRKPKPQGGPIHQAQPIATIQPAAKAPTVVSGQPIPAERPQPAGAPPIFFGETQLIATITEKK